MASNGGGNRLSMFWSTSMTNAARFFSTSACSATMLHGSSQRWTTSAAMSPKDASQPRIVVQIPIHRAHMRQPNREDVEREVRTIRGIGHNGAAELFPFRRYDEMQIDVMPCRELMIPQPGGIPADSRVCNGQDAQAPAARHGRSSGRQLPSTRSDASAS